MTNQEKSRFILFLIGCCIMLCFFTFAQVEALKSRVKKLEWQILALKGLSE